MVSSRCITSSSCSTASSNSVKTKCHGSSYYRPQPFGLSRTQWESPTTWFHKSLTVEELADLPPEELARVARAVLAGRLTEEYNEPKKSDSLGGLSKVGLPS